MSDLISRCELFNRLATVQTMADAYAVIQGMPTVEPERKTGRWRRQVNPKRECYGHWECCECGVASWEQTNFCSNCGAKMEVEYE